MSRSPMPSAKPHRASRSKSYAIFSPIIILTVVLLAIGANSFGMISASSDAMKAADQSDRYALADASALVEDDIFPIPTTDPTLPPDMTLEEWWELYLLGLIW